MDFEEWLEANRETIYNLLDGDVSEALYKAWFAGYEAGMERMGRLVSHNYSNN